MDQNYRSLISIPQNRRKMVQKKMDFVRCGRNSIIYCFEKTVAHGIATVGIIYAPWMWWRDKNEQIKFVIQRSGKPELLSLTHSCVQIYYAAIRHMYMSSSVYTYLYSTCRSLATHERHGNNIVIYVRAVCLYRQTRNGANSASQHTDNQNMKRTQCTRLGIGFYLGKIRWAIQFYVISGTEFTLHS